MSRSGNGKPKGVYGSRLRVAVISLLLFVLGVAGVLSLSLIWYPSANKGRRGVSASSSKYVVTAGGDVKPHRSSASTSTPSGSGSERKPNSGHAAQPDRIVSVRHRWYMHEPMPPVRPWSQAYQANDIELEISDPHASLSRKERESVADEAFRHLGRRLFRPTNLRGNTRRNQTGNGTSRGIAVPLPTWFVERTMYTNPSGTPNPRTWVLIQPGLWFKQNWIWHGAALLTGLGLSALAWYNPWVIKRRRAARGACASCGYDLRDTPAEGPCPECGKEVAVSPA